MLVGFLLLLFTGRVHAACSDQLTYDINQVKENQELFLHHLGALAGADRHGCKTGPNLLLGEAPYIVDNGVRTNHMKTATHYSNLTEFCKTYGFSPLKYEKAEVVDVHDYVNRLNKPNTAAARNIVVPVIVESDKSVKWDQDRTPAWFGPLIKTGLDTAAKRSAAKFVTIRNWATGQVEVEVLKDEFPTTGNWSTYTLYCMPVGTRMRNAWKIPEAEQEEPCVGRRVELLRLDLSYFKTTTTPTS